MNLDKLALRDDQRLVLSDTEVHECHLDKLALRGDQRPVLSETEVHVCQLHA